MRNKKQTFNARHSQTLSLKEIIDQLLNTYKLRGKFNETHLITSWEKIMGKSIASRTTRLYIKEKKMYIKLNSAPLKNELNMSKSKVLELLYAELGEKVIEEVIFL
jgi:hypothetical protein